MEFHSFLLVLFQLTWFTLTLGEERPHERGHLYEGDILLPPSIPEYKGPFVPLSGLRTLYSRWLNAKLIYLIDPSFKRINEKDFVYIGQFYPNCYSQIGRLGRGQQSMNLGQDCVDHGVVLHELVHSLGFYHEHTRSDRDSYIEINWKNISPGNYDNFHVKTQNEVTDFGVPYDIRSIMHYSPYAFAINKNVPTIKSRNPNIPLWSAYHLSIGDVDKLRKMYNIPSHWNCHHLAGTKWITAEKTFQVLQPLNILSRKLNG